MEGTVCEERQESRREPDRNMGIGVAPQSRWPKDITISKVANGFIVHIGCQTLVGKDWDEVSNGLDLYWTHPEKAEQLYLGKN